MKVTSTIASTFLITLISLTAIAQPENKPGERRGNIESQKIAFITSKLDLTPEEAQQFWPVYNQCQKRQKEIRERNKPKSGDGKRPNIDEMSDKEVENLINRQITTKQQELDIQKNCLEQYKKVLPIKKVAKLFQTERQFKRKLLNQIRSERADYPQREKRKSKNF
ncbi:MAG TPA: hypothetical protein EYN51_09925 [Flavobacteriales bacterium]|nr:hypothetical protein [Flavobacteriales bacterium]HIA10543.1 hypothetical protein [Flavobacteriales bacterium]